MAYWHQTCFSLFWPIDTKLGACNWCNQNNGIIFSSLPSFISYSCDINTWLKPWKPGFVALRRFLLIEASLYLRASPSWTNPTGSCIEASLYNKWLFWLNSYMIWICINQVWMSKMSSTRAVIMWKPFISCFHRNRTYIILFI